MVNVMYHYVRKKNNIYPHFKYLDIETFKRQLDFFEINYGFVSKDEYKEAIKYGRNPQGVVLTFDDGFKDHINFVLPELLKRNLWGLFYVSTGVYNAKRLLDVHRVHHLIGKYGATDILDDVVKKISFGMLDEALIDEFDKEIYIEDHYLDDERQVKRLLNYYLNYEFRQIILDDLMSKYFNELELYQNFYVSKRDIKTLVDTGNIVGSHTVSHRVLSRLSYQEQYQEIADSFYFIEGIVKQNYRSFCYPYGHQSSYNAETLKVLESLNVNDACIFDNSFQDCLPKKYELSRIDCNKFLEV